MADAYRCDYCGRHVPAEQGADDAIERNIGPICDECALDWEECDACDCAHQPKKEIDCPRCGGCGFVTKGWHPND